MSNQLSNIVEAAKEAIDSATMPVEETKTTDEAPKVDAEAAKPEVTTDGATEDKKTPEDLSNPPTEAPPLAAAEEVKTEAADVVATEVSKEGEDDKKRDADTAEAVKSGEEPPTKKAKAESKEGPMGELRPTDVLAGNYRKRAGNFLYKKLLREYAPEVGKVEMRSIVAKVVDGVTGQEPAGRFIREGGDALLSRAQTNQKVARALREVHERSQKEGEEGKTTGDGKPVVKKPKPVNDKQEPLGELRQTDVLTGNYRKRPGNFLYKKLLREHAPSVAKEEMRTVVTRVIEGIYAQNPPGRFIREGGGGLLTRGQVHQKVARALREVVERSTGDGEKQAAEKAAKKAKQAAESKDEPMGEVRVTDVLTGNYRKRPGNFLYKKLLREHAPAVGTEEMSLVVARVIDGISGQEPPGRFIREGGGSLLTRGQVRQKVARALREVVERSKNPDKDKKPPAITAADALAADAARKEAAKKAALEQATNVTALEEVAALPVEEAVKEPVMEVAKEEIKEPEEKKEEEVKEPEKAEETKEDGEKPPEEEVKEEETKEEDPEEEPTTKGKKGAKKDETPASPSRATRKTRRGESKDESPPKPAKKTRSSRR